MTRFLEFAGNHPFLVTAAVLMLILVIVHEMRLRAQAFAAVGPTDAVRLMNQGALVIDVRPPAQYETGHIVKARNIPVQDLARQADTLKKYREKFVITCCDTGLDGGRAARELHKLGFTRVVNLRGGLNGWRRENLPLVRGDEKRA